LVVLVAILGAIAINFRVSLLPPGVHKKQSLTLGAAATTILIDSPRSAVGDLQNQLDPLAQRTAVVALLIQSQAVRDDIGKRVGVPGAAIAVDASAQDPTAPVRANDLVVEAVGYRISATPDPGVPIVHIRTQAPSAKAAAALADATSASLQAYVVALQRKQQIEPAFRLQIRRLGQARGGLVNPGAGTKAGIVAAIAIILGGCILILLVSKFVEELRTERELEALVAGEAPESAPLNGFHSADAEARVPAMVGGAGAGDEANWQVLELHEPAEGATQATGPADEPAPDDSPR
jgi:hypothetical protein